MDPDSPVTISDHFEETEILNIKPLVHIFPNQMDY